MNPQDPKYQQKSKAISSAEPNYFVHFAMRHPVATDKLPFYNHIWSFLANYMFIFHKTEIQRVILRCLRSKS